MSYAKKQVPVSSGNLKSDLFVAYAKKNRHFYQASSDLLKTHENKIPGKKLSEIISQVQEGERIKMGHELHDGVAPLLAIALHYLAVVTPLTKKQKFAKDQAGAVILSAIRHIRAISSQLVVSQKIDSSLVHLIQELVKQINYITFLVISFIYHCENELSQIDPDIKLTLYRIVQEQLNNIIKHSKATHVKIALNYQKRFVELKITDDGIGFCTAKTNSGIGLANMVARINQCNGKIKVNSSPGNGCEIIISVPALSKK